MLARRSALVLLAGAAAAAFLPRAADASVAKAMTLTDLVGYSDRVVVAMPLEAISRWETVGKRRRIVTYTRLRVDDSLDESGTGDELTVRTLGGRVGEVGQIVHGEALLLVGRPAVVFLQPGAAGSFRVTGMAQGHFPLKADSAGKTRLTPSPRLGELVGADRSAVKKLVGQTVTSAKQLVHGARGSR